MSRAAEAPAVQPATYCLSLLVLEPRELRVGALGRVRLPAGWYTYTGSARRGLEARIARHLRRRKPLGWHIDYLTADRQVLVVAVARYAEPECRVNQRQGGRVLVPGLGASDCRSRCGSHLRYHSEG
ncbi:GIY-YIG nuclease family protein [Halorhodospira neutriphila]|uniref:GIY-YIG nuclease family protein n=1 Tax=Halorhodospira neutriphila TaxID=168379 RepID=UPI0030842063